MFSFVGMMYGILVPLTITLVLSTVIGASMLQKDARPREIAQSLFCYLMMSLGVLLMSAGALPTIISVLAGVKLSGATYFTLLIVFSAGGMLFLWNDALVHAIPERSRMVPETIYIYLFRIIGHLLLFLWLLSLVVSMLNGLPEEKGWWIMPIIMIIYGGLFVWCTRPDTDENYFIASCCKKGHMFTTTSCAPKKTINKVVIAKKAAPKKKVATKKKAQPKKVRSKRR